MKIKLAVKQSRYETNIRKFELKIKELEQEIQNKNQIIDELKESEKYLKYKLNEAELLINWSNSQVKQLSIKCHGLEFEKRAIENANLALWETFVNWEQLDSLIYKLNEIFEVPIEFGSQFCIDTSLNNSIISSFSLKKLVWLSSLKVLNLSKIDFQTFNMFADVTVQAISLLELIRKKLEFTKVKMFTPL